MKQRSYTEKQIDMMIVIGDQLKSNDIIDEFGLALASGTGIRKTVVVSM
jgi:hypothetical protein